MVSGQPNDSYQRVTLQLAMSMMGFLYRPPGIFTGKRPVIIDIHGGPEEQYRPGFGYEDDYYLNELGVVKIFPNVRGSTGYGKVFVNLDNGVLRNDALKDVGALLDWIKKQPDLDADQVMVQGVSHGGFIALSVAANYSDRIRAALSDSGPSNLVTFIENTAGWRRDLQRQEYGDERDPKTRAFLERISPANNVEKIKKPLMIVQGQNDPRVPTADAPIRSMLHKLKYEIAEKPTLPMKDVRQVINSLNGRYQMLIVVLSLLEACFAAS